MLGCWVYSGMERFGAKIWHQLSVSCIFLFAFED